MALWRRATYAKPFAWVIKCLQSRPNYGRHPCRTCRQLAYDRMAGRSGLSDATDNSQGACVMTGPVQNGILRFFEPTLVLECAKTR